MAADPWHYPRRALAERTRTLAIEGPAQALTLFAPRRTGKTEFLLRDVGPLAEEKGSRVVYASFWQAPLSPLAVLLHALEQSRRGGTLGDRMRELTLGVAPKLKLSAPTPAVKAEAEIDLASLRGKPPGELLLYLDDLLGALSRSRRPTLLLLDETQELGRDAKNAGLVAALRTSLDKRPEKLRAIFTGSSRQGLKAMFETRTAPFFHFATQLEFPPLEDDFVDHLLKAFNAATKRALPRSEAVAAFLALHRNPYFFRRMLEAAMLDPARTIAEALELVRGRIAAELGYPDFWLTLPPLGRGVVLLLARGEENPFGESARQRLGALLGEPAPTTGRVQAALRRLAREGLADSYAGRWMLDDPEFGRWALAQRA